MAKKKVKFEKPAAAKQEEPFFVGIKDPIGMRRAVLESTKDVVQSLQRFEKFTVARKKKREHIEKLKETVQETVKLIAKLKKSLPTTGLRMKPVQPPKPEPVKKKAAKKETKASEPKQKPALPAKEMGELEKLESELIDIESKLGNLT